MTTKKLISFDSHGYATKVQQVKQAVKGCNSAIYALNDILDVRINDLTDLEQYLKNPLQFFDSQMIIKLKFESENPNLELLANLHNVNRKKFILVVYGKDLSCATCTTSKSEPLTASCTAQYHGNKSFMDYDFSRQEFAVNQSEIQALEEKYRQYATPEEQKKIDFANDFISMINKGFEMGFLGYNTAQDLKRVHIGYAPAINRVSLPENIGHFINLINL
jgi:hypothetical protein